MSVSHNLRFFYRSQLPYQNINDVREAMAKNIFKGYHVGREEIIISHLSYKNNTLLIGKNSADNIMVLKNILRCFEVGVRVENLLPQK
ncbi:hypothetical protein Lal_00040169 [Lupinus albus]|nr:hypothetical protein Lal_00040169 [Lupinus albus]